MATHVIREADLFGAEVLSNNEGETHVDDMEIY